MVLCALPLTHAVLAVPVSSSTVLAMADTLMRMQAYDEAITEYKRLLFFSTDDRERVPLYFQMGVAYQKMGLWGQSTEALQKAIDLTDQLDWTNAVRLKLAVTSIVSHDYKRSLWYLDKILLSGGSQTVLRHATILKIITLAYLKEWPNAREVALTSLDPNDPENGKAYAEIIHLLSEPLAQKSIRKAGLLSTILPGMGQFYAGQIRSGVNALILNGLNLLACYALFAHSAFLEGTFYLLIVANRYYSGNIYQAELAVYEYNSGKIDLLTLQLLDQMSVIHDQK